MSERSDVLAKLLNQTKFNGSRAGLSVCVDLFDTVLPILPDDLCLVPVPTASSHVRERGFDHTESFVKLLSRQRSVPYSRSLTRIHNDTQHLMGRRERFRTAMKSYEVRGVPPKKALLVDDIYTTGATIDACARKLRDAGSDEIYVAILARQMPR